ncbi:MAG: hypothetical protein C4541_01490 [Candidatus Auribacter fodinae]|jgi:hypothetical protein|uniref:Helicase XPB/Ssl2 N-terminal domain-containing protein n=1 Tax=Candidatus Auribacter fodinae TaxID=2093366 RepID=A0A3A4R9V7_9BACT|nr:MAG: hypothetical protein C4541_01490 [Candidatus Auribacter fodinae]
MNFKECISQLNPNHLKTITETYGIVIIPFASQHARDKLFEYSNKPNFFKECLEYLSPEQKKSLFLINFFADYLPAPIINQFVEQSVPCQKIFETITVLLNAGFIFHIINTDTDDSHYIVPDELRTLLHSIVANNRALLFPAESIAPSRIHAEHGSFILGVFAVLIAGLKDELRFNMDKTLNKRVINKLSNQLCVIADSLGEDTLSAYCNALLAYVTSLDLITLRDLKPLFRIKPINAWVNLSYTAKQASFLNFIITSYDANYSWRSMMRFMAEMKEETFYPITALAELYKSFFKGDNFSEDTFYRKPLSYFPVFILHQLDIIEIGSSDLDTFCAWKITDSGMCLVKGIIPEAGEPQYDNRIIIQPNFELIISRDADPRILWKLYLAADIHQCDFLMRFHFNRHSVHRGLSQELAQPDIFSILESNTDQPIPQNVLYSLTEWCEEYGSVYFMDVFLLRCKTAQLAEQISLHPKTRDYIKGSFSDTDLIISREDYQDVFDILHSLDLMPLRKIRKPDAKSTENIPDFLIDNNYVLRPVSQYNGQSLKFIPGIII